MAMFGKGKNPKSHPVSRTPALPPPDDDHLDGVRLINGEATPRMNVPAIAMNGVRRPNISLPTTQHSPPTYTSHSVERRLIVGRDISLAGEISECDQLVVEGTIEAKLGHGKQLYISASGFFHGTAQVDEADIAGRYEGDLNVQRLRLRATSQFTGRVRFSFLEVEAGAQITADLEYVPLPVAEQTEQPSAVVNFPPYQAAQAAMRA